MTIKALYPTVRPILNLDFAKTKALDPRITFTRASTATFVGADGLIKTAASGAARFDHNPTTGKSLGLLVEEARTNLLNGSQTFATTGGTQNNWVDTNITRDGTLRTSPDGTANALRITASADNGTIISSAAIGTSASRTLSVFLRRVTGTGNIQYTLNNGSTWTTQAITSSWVRYTFSATTADQQVGIQIVTSGDAIELWGIQLEAGSFPTSYIPTVASTVTRAADVASMTGANFSSWYNQDQGTLVATTPSGIVTTATANQSYFGVSTGTLSGSIGTGNGLKYGNGSPYTYTRLIVTASSASQVDTNSATNAPKIAFAYATNNFALARGQSLFTDTLGDVPTGMDTFTIRGVGSQSYSHMAYYPVRLPDAQLQAITAT